MELKDRVWEELGKEIREMMFGIQMAKFAFDAESPEFGDAFVDVLIEELTKLKRKKEPAAPVRKAMLSQPMGGKSDEEIVNVQERAIAELHARGFAVESTLFTDEWYNKEAPKDGDVIQRPLFFLAKSLEKMSLCEAVYFCKGWSDARGCLIEHAAATEYGLEIIYEDQ